MLFNITQLLDIFRFIIGEYGSEYRRTGWRGRRTLVSHACQTTIGDCIRLITSYELIQASISNTNK